MQYHSAGEDDDDKLKKYVSPIHMCMIMLTTKYEENSSSYKRMETNESNAM